MRKLLKFLKFCVIAFVALILLVLLTIYVGHKFIYPIPYSAIATIPDIEEDGFCFGVNCRPAAKDADSFIPVFAGQIRNYNHIAPVLWPGNNVVNLYAAVESIEHNKSWLISPEGTVTKITTEELRELCPVRSRFNIGFNPFSNDTINGVYLALSEEALKNLLEYQYYQYLGTYDLFLTYSHEMFHAM